MPTKKTLKKIHYDSTASDWDRSAAAAINITRKRNRHIDKPRAIAWLKNHLNIPTDEAGECIEDTLSLAEDMEWR